MTFDQMQQAAAMHSRGHSALSIARCLTGVSYREIEQHFDFPECPEHFGFTAGFAKWLKEDCPYTWRPDNQDAPDAPWSRVPGLAEYEQS
jgi:hypothetical protein